MLYTQQSTPQILERRRKVRDVLPVTDKLFTNSILCQYGDQHINITQRLFCLPIQQISIDDYMVELCALYRSDIIVFFNVVLNDDYVYLNGNIIDVDDLTFSELLLCLYRILLRDFFFHYRVTKTLANKTSIFSKIFAKLRLKNVKNYGISQMRR